MTRLISKAYFEEFNCYVGLADLKMVLADF